MYLTVTRFFKCPFYFGAQLNLLNFFLHIFVCYHESETLYFLLESKFSSLEPDPGEYCHASTPASPARTSKIAATHPSRAMSALLDVLFPPMTVSPSLPSSGKKDKTHYTLYQARSISQVTAKPSQSWVMILYLTFPREGNVCDHDSGSLSRPLP